MLFGITLRDLVTWTHGRLVSGSAELSISSLSTDTRTLKKGDLFLALTGEHFDANQFIPEAIKKGACALILEKEVKSNTPCVVVENGLRALVSIGKALRDRFSGKVVAVVGSAGKSSTKEMIATLLGEDTVRSPASFNNLIGVSHTLLAVNDSTRNLVLEMGMNARGEIRELCEIFRPQYGVITNIGDAHIGKLGSKEAIYEAKKELFDYLASSSNTAGVAIHLSNPLVLRAYREAFKKPVPLISYALSDDPNTDVRLLSSQVVETNGYLQFSIRIQEKVWDFTLPIFGLHQAENILAAVASALLMGIPAESIRNRIPQIRPASHRGEILQLKQGIILIDESYNSNPTALVSALKSLEGLEKTRRLLLVLGDMRELGKFSETLHAGIGSEIVKLQSRRKGEVVFIAVGESIASSLVGVRKLNGSLSCHIFSDVSSLISEIGTILTPQDIVFIKGSRAVGLERLVELLGMDSM